MKNKKSMVTMAVVLVLLVVVMAGAYTMFRKKPVEGAKAITVEVVDEDGKTTTYEHNTDAEYLSEAMEEIEDLEFEVTDGAYGEYLKSVNGVKAVFEEDNAYWCTYVNGEYGEYSLSTQPIEDGGVYGIVYTPAE